MRNFLVINLGLKLSVTYRSDTLNKYECVFVATVSDHFTFLRPSSIPEADYKLLRKCLF